MAQHLSFAIRSPPIVWRTEMSGRTRRSPGTIRDPRCAHWTTDARDPSAAAHSDHDVTALLVTGHAHLVHTIPNFEYFFLFHNFSYSRHRYLSAVVAQQRSSLTRAGTDPTRTRRD